MRPFNSQTDAVSDGLRHVGPNGQIENCVRQQVRIEQIWRRTRLVSLLTVDWRVVIRASFNIFGGERRRQLIATETKVVRVYSNRKVFERAAITRPHFLKIDSGKLA